MAVAALSSSATALPITPAAPTAPAPASGSTPAVVTREPFAKLVERAKPDGKTSQDNGPPESPEPNAEAAAASDVVNGDKPIEEDHPTSEQPADLLAEIEAMAAAAAQIAVNIPAPVPVANAPTPIVANDESPEGAPTIASVITTASPTGPAPVIAASIRPAMTSEPANAPTEGGSTMTADAGIIAAEMPPKSVESPEPATSDTSAKPAPSNIAAMIASLKTALQPAQTAAKVGDAAMVAALAGTTVEVAPAATPIANAPALPAGPSTAAPQPVIATDSEIVETAVLQAGALPTNGKAKGEPSAAPAPTAPRQDAEAPLGAPVPAPIDIAPSTDSPARASETVDQPLGQADTALATAGEAPVPQQPAPVASVTQATQDISDATVAADAAAQADQSINRQLDLARGNEWLDKLARDITQMASNQGNLRFHLNPEHLGALTVEIANSAAGTAIRMTAETDQARAIIADAQPRLLAEVRAQGLRVSESHVDLNQQGNGGSAFAQGQQRQSSEDHKPFARTQAAVRDDAGDSVAHEDGELYA